MDQRVGQVGDRVEIERQLGVVAHRHRRPTSRIARCEVVPERAATVRSRSAIAHGTDDHVGAVEAAVGNDDDAARTGEHRQRPWDRKVAVA